MWGARKVLLGFKGHFITDFEPSRSALIVFWLYNKTNDDQQLYENYLLKVDLQSIQGTKSWFNPLTVI